MSILGPNGLKYDKSQTIAMTSHSDYQEFTFADGDSSSSFATSEGVYRIRIMFKTNTTAGATLNGELPFLTFQDNDNTQCNIVYTVASRIYQSSDNTWGTGTAMYPIYTAFKFNTYDYWYHINMEIRSEVPINTSGNGATGFSSIKGTAFAGNSLTTPTYYHTSRFSGLFDRLDSLNNYTNPPHQLRLYHGNADGWMPSGSFSSIKLKGVH